MSKQKTSPPQPPLRGKHASRAEQERQMRRLIIGGVIAVAVIVIGLLTVGLIESQILVPNQVVAEVNGERIVYRDYAKRVTYERALLLTQWYQYEQFIQLFGSDPNTEAFYRSQQNLIARDLQDAVALGRETLDKMIEEAIIRQEAQAIGITVTEDEIDRALEEERGFFRDGTPTPAPTFTPFPTGTPFATPIGATATFTPEPSPTATEGPAFTPTPSPSPFPTATPYTVEGYKENLAAFEEDLRLATNLSLADYRRLIIEPRLLREKVRDALFADIATVAPQVRARRIVLNPDDTALFDEIIARLQAGEDFVALAREFSLDPNAQVDGGDLGYFDLGQLGDATDDFNKIVFNADVGLVTTQIITEDGLLVVEVLDKRDRVLDDSEIEQNREEKFATWLTDRRDTSDITTYPNVFADQVPTEPQAPPTAG